MKKVLILVLLLLVIIVVGVPVLAWAQELIPTPDMVAPAALIAFGSLGLVSGTVGYVWRQRSETASETGWESEDTPRR